MNTKPKKKNGGKKQQDIKPHGPQTPAPSRGYPRNHASPRTVGPPLESVGEKKEKRPRARKCKRIKTHAMRRGSFFSPSKKKKTRRKKKTKTRRKEKKENRKGRTQISPDLDGDVSKHGGKLSDFAVQLALQPLRRDPPLEPHYVALRNGEVAGILAGPIKQDDALRA